MSLELVPTMDAQITVHGFSDEQERMLQEPLPTSLIKERKGPGGRMLKYIAGKTSIDNANRIFGYGKWGYRVLSKSHEKVGESEYYTADIELYVIGCPFPFPGEGVGVVTSNNIEGHEKARKEAVTDAMKRALRHFGDQFGLALYSEDSLVEDAQGNLVPVKNVHAGAAPAQPAKRVVDADKPKAHPGTEHLRNGDGSPAFPERMKPSEVERLFSDFWLWTGLDDEGRVRERWESWKATLFKQAIADQDLTAKHGTTMRERLAVAREKKAAATSGK